MPKKFLIPLIIFVVVLAAGLGIFIASNQSAQTPTTTVVEQKNELTIPEIERTITVPAALGETTYQINGNSILFYSEKYEKLDSCAGRHLGELRLTDTQTENTIRVGGQHPYATFVPQPMGPCGEDDGITLASVLSAVLVDAR